MEVIEALRTSILVPCDHLHIKQKSTCSVWSAAHRHAYLPSHAVNSKSAYPAVNDTRARDKHAPSRCEMTSYKPG